MLCVVMALWRSRAVSSSLWSGESNFFVLTTVWSELTPSCVCARARKCSGSSETHTHAHCNTCRAYEVSDHSLFLSLRVLKAADTCASKAVGGLWRVKETEGCWNWKGAACWGSLSVLSGPRESQGGGGSGGGGGREVEDQIGVT